MIELITNWSVIATFEVRDFLNFTVKLEMMESRKLDNLEYEGNLRSRWDYRQYCFLLTVGSVGCQRVPTSYEAKSMWP